MTLIILGLKPDYVFDRLQKGIKCIAINFERGEYIDLSGLNVRNVQCLMANTNVRFYTVEGSES